MSPANLTVQRLGCVPYAAALDYQNQLVQQRARGEIGDHLLLLQHPPTYTLGSAAQTANLLLSAAECAAQGISVVATDRGGDVTYHGPGQCVVYPIIQLRHSQLRGDVLAYLRRLEMVMQAVLAGYGVTAYCLPGLTGVWVDTPPGAAKIGAIGVRVTAQGVTKHGFALNVCPNLDHFQGIIPCGIRDKGVTSLAALLGAATPPLASVEDALITQCAAGLCAGCKT